MAKRTVTLTDPRALRAFAHPARQRIVEELFSGRVLTATEAAELVGLSPSAVSHHLRVLERWGLAERAPATDDGREHPWQGTGRSLNLNPAAGPASRTILAPVVSRVLSDLGERVQAFLESAADEPWTKTYNGLSRSDLWLTRAETQALRRVIAEAIEAYADRNADTHPADARRTALTVSLLPTEPAPTVPQRSSRSTTSETSAAAIEVADDGLPTFAVPPGAPVITAEDVASALDDD